VRGDWVYDAGHAGWNEVHPVRHVQRLDNVPPEFHGATAATRDLVDRFKREVLDPWCFEVARAEDPRPRRPLFRQGRTVTHAAPPATATPWGLWPTENVSMT
jgi:hypothetical protein